MYIKDLLDYLIITGKIDSKTLDNISCIQHMKDVKLSKEQINLFNLIIKSYKLDTFRIVELVYNLTKDSYVKFLRLLYKYDYEGNLERAICKYTGYKLSIQINKDSDFIFGNIKITRINKNLLGVLDQNNNMICKGGIFILDDNYVYRVYDRQYMLRIDKNGNISKIKKKKDKVIGLKLQSY